LFPARANLMLFVPNGFAKGDPPMKRATVAVAAVIVMLLFTSAAWAACAQSDLTGTWMTYQAGVSGGSIYWQRCSVRLDSTGRVIGGSCRDDIDQTFSLTRGRIRVSSECVVTGTAGGADGIATINHGALDRGKTVFMGVLTDSDNGIATIQGVKK
jgi:hypothetical protein